MIDLAAGRRQYCTFRLGQYLCGIDALSVQVILRSQTLTRVPLAPPVVKGLINLHGQIITAMDMRTRLGFPAREDGKPPVNIVVGLGSGGDEIVAALLVDEIGDVIDIDPSTCEDPPDTIHGAMRDVLLAVSKRDKGLLLILDTAKAMKLD